ncbi:MAG: hypothetical protein LBC02_10720 [Planctomycetaceae bacterium]|nr:hypothetical protein [Planctomycetaceae bacterium]
MKAIKIYLDTSVISMLDNPDLGAVTRKFFELAKQRGCQFVISEIVKKEIDGITNTNKGAAASQIIESLNCVLLPYSQESYDLARTYVLEGILTENHVNDLRHVAYATVFGCSVIVSWNRRHIAKPIKIQKLNACNIKNNYPAIVIYTPEEFLILYK